MARFLFCILLFTALSLVASLHSAADKGTSLGSEWSGSVFMVTSLDGRRGGTGFAVQASSGRAYLMTNGHICELATDGMLLVVRGARVATAHIYEIYDQNDLCLVELPFTARPLLLGNGLRPYQKLYTLGHPHLKPLTLSSGYVVARLVSTLPDPTRTDEESCNGITRHWLEGECIRSLDMVDTTIPTYPGNSGSPVLNDEGSVVGVIFATNGATNFGSFVPLSDVREFLSVY